MLIALFEGGGGEKIILDGYWQSERYFIENMRRIVRDLMIKERKLYDCDPLAGRIRSEEHSVFLHIRSYREVPGRGDGSAALPVSYFQNALAFIRGHLNRKVAVFVFSDDVDWALSQLHFPPELNPVFVNHTGDDSEGNTLRDFHLMRLCKHGIVANSSFSWWAGWLGEQDALLRGERPIRVRVNMRCMNDDYWPYRWVEVNC